jgi:hypothetical protein
MHGKSVFTTLLLAALAARADVSELAHYRFCGDEAPEGLEDLSGAPLTASPSASCSAGLLFRIQ